MIQVRIPVPNNGACDWGLPEAKSCSYCKKYYDPRYPEKYGNTDNGKCVWVPNESKCFPKKWVKDKQFLFDEECSGNSHFR